MSADIAVRSLLRGRSEHLRIKICCIASIAEAGLAIEAKADAIGLVSAMPSGPGVIGDHRIAEVIQWIDGRVVTVLLTSRQDVAEIAAQLDAAHPSVVQLTDALALRDYGRLRSCCPGVELMQVIHVRDDGSVREAIEVAPYVDALLLDSGNPTAIVKELGGTGRVHNWSLSRRIRESVNVPVFLAGGLGPGNVAAAVKAVRPFGVDICSGLRPAGGLDEKLLDRFVKTARGHSDPGLPADDVPRSLH